MTSPRIALTFAERHPVGGGLLLNPDEFRGQHQRGEVHNRHVRRDAVVVGRIALRHRQRLAAALRGTDVIVVLGLRAVHALHQHHGGIVRLLHLHVAEVLDRFVIQPPVDPRARAAARRDGRTPASGGPNRCRRWRSRAAGATVRRRRTHHRQRAGRCR